MANSDPSEKVRDNAKNKSKPKKQKNRNKKANLSPRRWGSWILRTTVEVEELNELVVKFKTLAFNVLSVSMIIVSLVLFIQLSIGVMKSEWSENPPISLYALGPLIAYVWKKAV